MTMTLSAPPTTARIHRCDKHPEKMQYRTTDQAFDVAERRAPQEGVPIYVYACDHCGYFHLSKKRGTESIGRLLEARADGLLWSSSTANPHNPAPERDARYLDTSRNAPTRLAVTQALREHGNPDVVTMAELLAWTRGHSRGQVRTALYSLGWVGEGSTKRRRYHRTAVTISEIPTEYVPTEPAAEPEPAEPTAPAPAPAEKRKPANPSNTQRLVAKAIREHGSPDSVTMAELREWTGIDSNSMLRHALSKSRWIGVGVTTQRRYYRNASVIPAELKASVPAAAAAPPSAGAWRTVNAADFVAQETLRVLGLAQVEIEIRVRNLV